MQEIVRDRRQRVARVGTVADFMSLLNGIAFLSHQHGNFSGVFLEGYLYEQSEAFEIISSFCGQYLGFESYGDASRYDLIWLINILIGVLAAVIHLPIKEKAVGRFAVN